MGNDPKPILIRYKDSPGPHKGDVSSFNNFNMTQSKFDGPKYGGFEEWIPGNILDDNDRCVEYKGRPDINGGRNFDHITKLEYRRRLFETGGYTNHGARNVYEPAPPRLMQNKTMLKVYLPARKLEGQALVDFMYKTKVGVLFLEHFNPICMELVGDIPDEVIALLKKKAKANPGSIYDMLSKGPDVVAAVNKDKGDPDHPTGNEPPLITDMDENNACNYVKELKDVDLLKAYAAQESRKSRPRVAVEIEQQIQRLSQNGEL
jgi:hypothetical protein